MVKGSRRRRTRRRRPDAAPVVSPRAPGRWSPAALVDGLLHPRTPDERPWKLLVPVLVVAFAARAAIALSGDFVLHPDEIMQYLEPAHRLVFGNGVTYWEYFYGARSWLVPGVVAGVLKGFDLAGLGEPSWYVGGVKLMFCAVSLLIPAGMYFFARWHLDEMSARIALVAGALWYELIGFAHKPMTEFVATALLMALLALCVRPPVDRGRTVWLTVWLIAFVAVLMAAVRLQYAPLALLLLGVFFLRTEKKVLLAVAAGVFLLAVGVFDAVTWDRGLFHSYATNIRFNLLIDAGRAGESPGYQFLWWLLLASAGLSALCAALSLGDPGRYGLLILLIAVVLLIHSTQAHKEYRFIFAVVPLWLLVGAGLVAQWAARMDGRVWMPATVLFAGVSLGGILNALPLQDRLYRAHSRETGKVGFLLGQDPVFPAYRHLARAPGVQGVWQVDRFYFNLPGYYYLHRRIPFYDAHAERGLGRDVETMMASVSHIVSAAPDLAIPGWMVEKEFGDIRIWRRGDTGASIPRWEAYAPIVTGVERIMRQIDPDAPVPPEHMGIRFVAEGE